MENRKWENSLILYLTDDEKERLNKLSLKDRDLLLNEYLYTAFNELLDYLETIGK